MTKLPIFFRDEELRRQIAVTQKLEILAISLIEFLGPELDAEIRTPLKNLLFYVHQSTLLQIKLVLNRLPAKNSWAKKLVATIDTKINRRVSGQRQIGQTLNQQNQSCISVIRNIYKIRPSRSLLEIVLSLIDEIDFIPTLKVREIMYNKESHPLNGQ